MEQIPDKLLENKRRIAARLDFLAKENLAHVQPYLASQGGEHIIQFKNDFWQMIPFVQGVELDREKYMYENGGVRSWLLFLLSCAASPKDAFFKAAYFLFPVTLIN